MEKFCKNSFSRLKMRFLTGFTLVEVIVVMAILSFVFGIILYFLVIGEENLSIMNTKVTLQQHLRSAVRTITEELSQAKICSLESEHKITCTIPTEWSGGEPSGEEIVVYQLNSNNITRNGNLVISDINLALDLSRFESVKSDVFKISIKAEKESSRKKSITMDMGSNFYLRNHGI